MKVACSRLGFFIVDLEGRASVAATLLPVDGGVQQEKLLLQTNNFCGGWHRVIGRHEVFRRGSFKKSSAGSSMANSQSA
jgi:hypothetical protein